MAPCRVAVIAVDRKLIKMKNVHFYIYNEHLERRKHTVDKSLQFCLISPNDSFC